jgi:hypothetical protein
MVFLCCANGDFGTVHSVMGASRPRAAVPVAGLSSGLHLDSAAIAVDSYRNPSSLQKETRQC